MIIIALVLSIFFIVIIAIICRAYLKDIIELEDRLLQLEKRIVEFENTIKNDYKGIYVPINEDFKVLLPLCEKDKFNLKSLEYAYNLIKNGEEDDNMACKKGKGGKRK